MRLVTWNCCRGDYRWKLAALEPLAPDVVVLQEAPLPKDGLPDGHVWVGRNPRLGMVIAGFDGYTVAPGPESACDAAYPVTVRGPHALAFHLLAVWTKKTPGYVEGLCVELDAHERFLRAAPAVVMGDFNSNARWDRPRAPVDHSRLVRRLEGELGLVSAYHAFHGVEHGCEAHPTHYFTWREDRPYHIDYCFVPKAWSITGVGVGSFDEWRGLSDHRPLIVDLG